MVSTMWRAHDICAWWQSSSRLARCKFASLEPTLSQFRCRLAVDLHGTAPSQDLLPAAIEEAVARYALQLRSTSVALVNGLPATAASLVQGVGAGAWLSVQCRRTSVWVTTPPVAWTRGRQQSAAAGTA